MTTRKDRFLGSLMGVRIGDALGMPFESLTHEQIMKITGSQGVTTFWNPQQHRTDAPDWAKQFKALRPGDYTDDWQMTKAGALSLLRRGQFDLEDLALAYIDEMNGRELGWGGTTRRSLREIELWLMSFGRDGRSPAQFARFSNVTQGEGCGNGVAMRIAPFALMASCAFNPNGDAIQGGIPIFQQMIWDVGGITHPDPRASISAYAVAAFIARLAARDGEPATRKELLLWLPRILEEVITMEVTLGDRIQMPAGTEKFSTRLEWVLAVVSAMCPDTKCLREKCGTSCYALESVPFSIAMFLLHPTDFRLALKETVEAGGDTDTNAAIVGSLVGANVGLDGIPSKWWRKFRYDFIDAKNLGAELYALSEEKRLTAGSTS